MKIGGLHKVSLIDYPGSISAILFTQGCNFRCPFCHNPELVDPKLFEPPMPHEEIFGFLDKRRGKLDAVVITGGEPTLQPSLVPFIEKIRAMGYRVKIDTNGALPEVLGKLLAQKLVDYVAMDVKAPFEKYPRVTRTDVDTGKIQTSMDLLRSSGVCYEFRTTVARGLLSPEDIRRIGALVRGAERFVLQRFIPSKCLDNDFLRDEPYRDDELEEMRKDLEKDVENVLVR